MTEQEQIKTESLKIHEQRLLNEKIQNAANELYDAGNKLKNFDDITKTLFEKWSIAVANQHELTKLWTTFLEDRDYDKFCKGYTKITNS